MIRRSVVCHLKKNLFQRYHKFPQTKPRLDGLALAGLDTRLGQSPHEAGYLAWLGLAYFRLALAGSQPQAGPGKTLVSSRCTIRTHWAGRNTLIAGWCQHCPAIISYFPIFFISFTFFLSQNKQVIDQLLCHRTNKHEVECLCWRWLAWML